MNEKFTTLINKPYLKIPHMSLLRILDSIADSPFGIYGSGTWGHNVYSIVSEILNRNPDFFSDSNQSKWGNLYFNKEIISPGEIAKKFGSESKVIVAIESVSRETAERKRIINALTEGGVKEENIYFTLWLDLSSQSFYMDKAECFSNNNAKEMETVFGVLSDDLSRKHMIEYIRMHKEYDVFRLPVVLPQYFLGDIFELRHDEVIADCGAYTGTTIIEIINYYKDFKHIHSFEASPKTYEALNHTVSEFPNEIRNRITTYSVAIINVSGKCKFNDYNTGGDKISENGSVVVDCAALDDIFKSGEQLPTLIKMDIEGAELLALKGAEGIISRGRPVLAICIYHKPHDVWEIPMWCIEHCKEYQFFMRKCCVFVNGEFVFYAVPNERCI